MNFVRVSRDVKLFWLLILHVTAASNLHLCFARRHITPAGKSFQILRAHSDVPNRELEWWLGRKYQGTYFYAHNETRVGIARAEAEATAPRDVNNGSSILGSSTKFPEFPLSKDGCNWDHGVVSDLSVVRGEATTGVDELQFMAVDSCVMYRDVYFQNRFRQISSQEWRNPKPHIDLFRDSPRNSSKVFVLIRAVGLEVLADGVYYSATGKMHLVGCTGDQHLPQLSNQRVANLTAAGGASSGNISSAKSVAEIAPFRLRDAEKYHSNPPLNSNSSSEHVCAISVTLQYPPLNPRWNSQRVLKFTLRSTRDKDDPLYFDPVERTTFFPYRRHYNSAVDDQDFPIDWQRRFETGGRILLLILGLVCVAKQIEHGRHNEEALPFVSLGMLGIQLANHLSQTPIFKDLQIGRYQRVGLVVFNSAVDFKYYGTMAWSEYVPYQAMAMAALFMYVWIFHRVGDRRRIMQLRVRKGRPGAKDPPRDGPLVFATLTIFAFVGILGVGFRVYSENVNMHTGAEDFEVTEPVFVSPRFYELAQAQWGFVNKMTGLVVSLFLVPQLLGNLRWEVQGRPLR